MNKMKKIMFLAAMLLMCATAMTAQTTAQGTAEDNDAKYATELLKKGAEAPDFNIGGEICRLSNLKGKYVVVDFWATWCPDCRKDIPKMKELYAKYASEKITFVGVSFDKTPDALQKYVQENGVEWVQTCEYKPWKETQVSKDYHINWIPSMYVINPEGRVEVSTVMIEKVEQALKEISGK